MQEFIHSLPGLLLDLLKSHGPKVLVAIAIVVIGNWIAKILRNGLKKTMLKRKLDVTMVNFACSVAYAMLMAFVIIAALGKLGVQTSSLVAILGASALAIGLALQNSLSNLAAGVLILFTRPFKIGQYVETVGNAGVVDNISILTTTIKTVDNKKVIIPNSSIINGPIINYTAENRRRVDLTVGVSYDSDLKKARAVLVEEISKLDKVLKDPAPFVGVSEMADSSVNFTVRSWVKTEDYWDVFFTLNENIKLRLDAENIPIPFPQADIHLFKAN
ncbi:mechanosensitive ion channel protein [Candidatus Fermentibacteria bacterium]|nr:MAG: mechanosensitive ion channel protein [Candidatus Fermentibacteria bacterium]